MQDSISWNSLDCFRCSRGAGFLHQQNPPIVHRDLATKNVLLTRNKQAKIADLGIAKCFSLQQTMYSSPNCGTPAYAAPETLSTKQAQKVVYGVKIDIFSFGVMLMEVVNSSRPKMEPDWLFDKGLYIFFCIQVNIRQNERRFRRRALHEPNLIRIKADPNYLDRLIWFRRRS